MSPDLPPGVPPPFGQPVRLIMTDPHGDAHLFPLHIHAVDGNIVTHGECIVSLRGITPPAWAFGAECTYVGVYGIGVGRVVELDPVVRVHVRGPLRPIRSDGDGTEEALDR